LGRREILDQQFAEAFLALRVMDERNHFEEAVSLLLTLSQAKFKAKRAANLLFCFCGIRSSQQPAERAALVKF